MAKQHLTAADFQACNTVQGKDLEGIDQGAIKAQERIRDGYAMDRPWDNIRSDYDAAESIHRRSSVRGSAIFKRKDMMCNPPKR